MSGHRNSFFGRGGRSFKIREVSVQAELRTQSTLVFVVVGLRRATKASLITTKF